MSETIEQIINRLNDLETNYLNIPTSINIDNSYFNYYKYQFTPIPLDGNWIWLDAADSTTITQTVDGKISTWKDKSINQYTFSMGGIASSFITEPSYNSVQLNNLPTVSFNRDSSQCLICNNNPSLTIGNSSFYFFIVYKYKDTYLNDGSNFQSVFNKSSGTYGTSSIECSRGSGSFPNRTFIDILDNNSQSRPKFNLAAQGAIFNIYSLICNRNTPISQGTCDSTVYVNGYNYDISVSSIRYNYNPIFLSTTTNPIIIGAFGTDSVQQNSFLNGSIAEIIGYVTPANMSIKNIMKVEGYLAWKWGLVDKLPSTHLYKLKPPYVA